MRRNIDDLNHNIVENADGLIDSVKGANGGILPVNVIIQFHQARATYHLAEALSQVAREMALVRYSREG